MKPFLLTLVSVLAMTSFAVRAQEADSKPPTAAAAGGTPATAPAATHAVKGKHYTGEAKAVEDRMEGLFNDSKKVNAPGATGKQAREKIESALDWDRIAKDCLGTSHWNKASAKNREQFRNLLHEVIVKTAYSRFDTFWKGTTYKFDKIDMKGGDSHVVSKFYAGGDTFDLEYYLSRKGSNWFIYDIAFDGIRYSKNINEQLNAFLKENGFPNLISKLRKRLAELDEAAKSDKE